MQCILDTAWICIYASYHLDRVFGIGSIVLECYMIVEKALYEIVFIWDMQLPVGLMIPSINSLMKSFAAIWDKGKAAIEHT